MEVIIGTCAGVLTAISMLPQLVKVIREQDVETLSPVMIMVLLSGVSLWVVYGIMIREWPIIVFNAFSVLINIAMLICYFIFRKRQ